MAGHCFHQIARAFKRCQTVEVARILSDKNEVASEREVTASEREVTGGGGDGV